MPLQISRTRTALRERFQALWPHWYELVPEVVLVGGLTFFLVDEPDAATSSFESLRAVGLIIGVTIAWLAARVLLVRFMPWPLLRVVLFGVAAVGILAIVVFPAYDEETVIEAFPGAPVAAPKTSRTTATTAPEQEQDAPAERVLVRTSTFRGIDHRASGTVSMYRRANGTLVVGLERFDIQPGPDYDVYIVPGQNREDRDGGIRLDDLRGNKGTQYYDLPADVTLDDGPWTVLIWCVTFGVPIANSTPAAV
jgi:hypothetical protein